MADGALPAGWALEDGVAVLFTNGRPTEAVSRRPDARLYRVEPDGRGKAGERAVPCRPLSAMP